MLIGITKEWLPKEKRVATTPDVVKKLRKKGFDILIETGAGIAAGIADQDFVDAGATITNSAKEVWDNAKIMIRIHPPSIRPDGSNEMDWLRTDHMVISNIFPGSSPELVERLQQSSATVFALDCVPRISRAQKMDVRSSMDNIAGYRAVVEAANQYSGFFGGQMTAAGKTPPAKVLIIGAGVAGLAAIGAARGLGAVVRAFDVRAAVKEQIQSMGAEFLEVNIKESGDGGGGYAKVMSDEYHKAQMELFLQQAKEVDIVISTANIPGRKAPILWEKRHVEAMKAGSVFIDLAAERGGNCELTQCDEVVEHNSVKIVGFTDFNSKMASVSSQFFGMNVFHMLSEFGEMKEENAKWNLDLNNNIIRGSVVLHNGEKLWPPPAVEPSPTSNTPAPEKAPIAETTTKPVESGNWRGMVSLALALIFAALGMHANSDFLQHFSVFILSCFIGWQVVWNVSHSLHTPLMSVTNAISGIIIVGGMLQMGGLKEGFATNDGLAAIIALVAILLAAINVAGGFLVTKRMLNMFRRD